MAAILWVDEDFDRNIAVEVDNNAIPLAQNLGSWCGQAIAGAAGTSALDYLQVDNVVGHLGILRVPTGSTNGNSSMLFLGRDSQSGGPSASEVMVPMDAFLKMEAYVRIPTITTVNCKIGLGQNINSSTFGTDAYYLDYNASTNPNWVSVTREGGSQTITDTGVPVVAGAWYKLTLRRFTTANLHMHDTVRGAANGAFCFYINDVAEPLRPSHIAPGGPGVDQAAFVHHNANQPSDDLVLGARVATQAGSARNFDIDRIRVWIDDAAMVT